LKIITKTWLHKFLDPCPNHDSAKPPTVGALAICYSRDRPESVKNLIELAELPPPEIKHFKADPSDVPPNSKSNIKLGGGKLRRHMRGSNSV